MKGGRPESSERGEQLWRGARKGRVPKEAHWESGKNQQSQDKLRRESREVAEAGQAWAEEQAVTKCWSRRGVLTL